MLDFRELTLAMGKLDDEKVVEILTDFVKSCPSKQEALEVLKICQLSMDMVGESYEKGEYFVADLIFAGKLLTMSMDILKPVLCNHEEVGAGKILIGTVQGDLHDIGKNIFKGLAKTVGFELFDLGIDVSVETFVEKAKIVKPDIIGLSGILTIAINSMKSTVEGLKKAGIEAKIIIGGVPVSEKTCAYIGADAFTNNAAEGVRICQDWM